MRNRRNVRKKRNIVEIISNKNFIIISSILLIIILLSMGILYYRQYKDKELLAKQKSELEKQTHEIFADIETLASNTSAGVQGKSTAKIAAVGDILCGTDMLSDAKQGETYSFNHMFDGISKFIKNADLSIGTLETNFTENEYSGVGKYNSPIEFLQAVKNSGIDLVSVAHNHILDYGISGYEETIKIIQDNGLDITGIKDNTENENKDFSGIIKEVNGIKIAVLSYTYGLSNEGKLTEEEKNVANIYSEEKVKFDIEYAKENSNYIMVIMHWGEVNNSVVSPWQEEVKNYLVDNGVDMILGSHPSVIEPMEIVQNSEGRNVLVAYSLGNYISSFKYENADVELILNIEITKESDSEKAVLKKVDYTPIYVLDNGTKADNRFELTGMKQLAVDYAGGDTTKISRTVYNKLINKIEWLDGIVNNNGKE